MPFWLTPQYGVIVALKTLRGSDVGDAWSSRNTNGRHAAAPAVLR
jgi:hypothetical protein